MQFTTLPGTGISVSRLCLGTMTFGSPVAEPDAIRLVHDAAEHVKAAVDKVVKDGEN